MKKSKNVFVSNIWIPDRKDVVVNLFRSEGVVENPSVDYMVNTKSHILSIIVILTLSLGWKYPVFGLVVPAVMLMGIIVGIFRGRYSCGNLCPRGVFYNAYLTGRSRNKKIPAFLKDLRFRWSVYSVMMFYFLLRLIQSNGTINDLGMIFWTMCAATTGIGIIVGLLFKPRTWCSFCPMGTLQRALGGHRNRLEIAASNVKYGICEKVCPMEHLVSTYKEDGRSKETDCPKCRVCTRVCPKRALDVLSYRKNAAKNIYSV